MFVRRKIIFSTLLLGIFLLGSFYVSRDLLDSYVLRASSEITDRHGKRIALLPNNQGYYAQYIQSIDHLPPSLEDFLLHKEDRHFYYHPGVSPLSIVRHAWESYQLRDSASSTLTLQLVKILYGHENERTVRNKLIEIIGSFSLELFTTKEQILTMYYNSVFLGNGAQGIASASRLYFGKDPVDLTEGEIISLLATLNNPSGSHPFSRNNFEKSQRLATSLSNQSVIDSIDESTERKRRLGFRQWHTTKSMFEVGSFYDSMDSSLTLTLDTDLTEKIRELTYRQMQKFFDRKAFNAAVVVVSIPDNEILTLIGSPDPAITDTGYQINMLTRERHVGSTIKPLIYTKGFEAGLRPHTLVDDREFKYAIGSGYALYPKNYDYTYNGIVNLQYALANSLNVPTVKVLEHIGPAAFSTFLEDEMGFIPHRSLNTYGLGIALGDLEMTLLELTHAISVFPQRGNLKPLTLSDQSLQLGENPLGLSGSEQRRVLEESSTDLTNAIVSERLRGIDQFGLRSNLELPVGEYGVKTGTSENYRDSLAVGYTGDYVVGVWVGNADFTPMDGISGERGAGKIWHDVMTLLYHSDYNKGNSFKSDQIISSSNIRDATTETYALKNDSALVVESLIDTQNLILNPHQGDTFLWSDDIVIMMQASEPVTWSLGDETLSQNAQVHTLKNIEPGTYTITASTSTRSQTHTITIAN